MSSLKKFLSKEDYVSINLKLTKTNHFELRAHVNGIEGRFILDTGASNTCIGLDKVEFFNLISEQTEIKAAGAGATEMETFMAKNNTIEIGDWRKKRQKLILFDLVHVNQALLNHKAEPVDGIIGADILKKGKAIIDYEKTRLYLRKNKKRK